jgi:LPXTG-motif cell wall-anchored protein
MAWRKATGILAAAIAGTLLLASPAYADGTIPLKAQHSNNTAQGWLDKSPDNQKDCTDDVFVALGQTATEDGWHFVLPASSGDSFTVVTLHFTKPDATPVTVTLSSTSLQSGSGWRGYLRVSGSDTKHAYVITEAGWTLVDGSADVTGTPDANSVFNLSHVCPGTPGTSTSPSPSPSPSASASSSPGTSTSTDPGTGSETTPGGNLPTTGVALTGIIALGGGLIAGGTALLFLRRRRDSAAS